MKDATARVPGGWLFWCGVLIGWAVMAFGVWGAIYEGRRVDQSLAIWMIGGLVAHDLVAAPLVFLAGATLRRVVGSRYRAAVHAALFVSAMFVVVSVPVLGGFGLRRDNPSVLPRDYATGLLVILAAIWTLTAVVLFMAWRASRRA